MAIISSIQKTIIEADQFTTGSSNLVVNIPLTTGQTISFTAESQFFTPRQIATNKSDVLGLPSESVVGYTSNLIPVIKMPIGARDITTPQYYPLTVVSDVYQNVPIDNFFRELVDDLALPDDATFNTLRDQRNAALEAALALDDLNAAAAAGDIDAFNEATEEIDEGLASAIPAPEIDPSAALTPEEEDELGALDVVGLTDDYGSTDAAADVIDPVPEVLEDDLIQRIPRVSGRVKGTETINQAINLLNTGIQSVEDATQTGTDDEGKCKYITVAKGKRGLFGSKVGAKKERKVKRSDIEEKLKKVEEELAKQNATNAPLPGYYKKKKKVGIFSKAFTAIANGLGKAGFIGQLLGGVILAPLTPAVLLSEAVTSGKTTVPMNKAEILKSLESAKKKLQDILDKEC